MIGWLRGRLLRKSLPLVVLDVGGVGYEVAVPLGTFGALPAEGESVELDVLTVFRADSLQLYGFRTAAEKRVFATLLAVSGVGPKLALSILSSLEPAELAAAVEQDHAAVLERVPGIGRKTARRLVLELKDRLAVEPDFVTRTAPAVPGEDEVAADAVAALVNLGYRRPDAERAVRETVAELAPADLTGLIRSSLRRLGDGR